MVIPVSEIKFTAASIISAELTMSVTALIKNILATGQNLAIWCIHLWEEGKPGSHLKPVGNPEAVYFHCLAVPKGNVSLYFP